MYEFEIYRLFCMQYIKGGVEYSRILNINEFWIIVNFQIILKHVEWINIFYIWTIYYTYRNDKLIWRKLRANDLAAVFSMQWPERTIFMENKLIFEIQNIAKWNIIFFCLACRKYHLRFRRPIANAVFSASPGKNNILCTKGIKWAVRFPRESCRTSEAKATNAQVRTTHYIH